MYFITVWGEMQLASNLPEQRDGYHRLKPWSLIRQFGPLNVLGRCRSVTDTRANGSDSSWIPALVRLQGLMDLRFCRHQSGPIG